MNKRSAHPSFEAVSALFAQPAPQPLVILQRAPVPTVKAVSAGYVKCVNCTLQDRCIRRTVPLQKRCNLSDVRSIGLQAANRARAKAFCDMILALVKWAKASTANQPISEPSRDAVNTDALRVAPKR